MATCLSTMSLLFVVLIGFLCASNARKHTFYVGEKDGWTMKPSESYNQWAEIYHFLVNDELVFKYKSGHDSVLVVNESDYYKCNKDNPIKSLKAKDGESRLKLDRSGPFFFISGHNQNCEDGQKLIVVVSSHHHHLPSPTHAPSPSRDVEPHSDHSPSPSPVAAAKTTAHAPLVESPSPSPADIEPRSPSPTPAEQPYFEPHSDWSPSPSPAAATPLAHAPPVDPPSPSPAALNDIEQHSDGPPAPGGKTPAQAPLIEPPSQSPLHDDEPDSDGSPAAATTPDESPSASPRKKAGRVPSDHIALSPDAEFWPENAPAPAPSSGASALGASFAVVVGFSVVATIISTAISL